MDFTSEYCPQRKHLEQCSWKLVDKLCVLTHRLMQLVGKDRTEFMAAKGRCADLRSEILVAHERLLAHRFAHGC